MVVTSETVVTEEQNKLSTVMFSTIDTAANWITEKANAFGTPAGLTAATSFAELASNALIIYPNLQENEDFLAWKLAVTSQEYLPPNQENSEPVDIQLSAAKEADAFTSGTVTSVKDKMNQVLSTIGAQAKSGRKQFSSTHFTVSGFQQFTSKVAQQR